MALSAEDIFFHLSDIDSAKGTWLIAIDCVKNTQSGNVLLLNLILEQTFDDGERFVARELGMMMHVSSLHDPDARAHIVHRIRDWIETTEGDGFLDLTAKS